LLAQTPAPKPGRVEGTVTNSVTGGGIRKAEVIMNGQAAQNVLTDATGHFAIENVTPGGYSIQVNCPGYAFPPPGVNGLKQIKVAEQQEVKDVSIKLTPLSVVSGKVRDENGEAVPHVQIQAFRFSYWFGHRQLSQSGFAMTNDLGQFRMYDLQPGKYFFMANPQMTMGRGVPEGTITDFENLTYAATYYPSGLDIAQASVQEVKAGEELAGLEFRLKRSPSFHIRGSIVRAADEERGLVVQVFRAGRPTNAAAHSPREDGSWDIPNVVPGEYTLIATLNGRMDTDSARATIIVSDHDVDDVKLTMEPALTLHGASIVEGTSASPQTAAIHMSLEPSEGPGGGHFSGAQATIKDDGTFEMKNIVPDIYALNIMGAAPRYVKSIQFDGQDIPSGTLDLTQHRGGELQLVFGTDAGQIHGTTSPSITITATPAVEGPIRRDQFSFTQSDANGNFQFLNLAPGKYQIMAWENGDLSPMQIPELRKQLEGSAASVTLSANGNESVQVTLIPADQVAAALQKLP